jgi:hypothetical protein
MSTPQHHMQDAQSLLLRCVNHIAEIDNPDDYRNGLCGSLTVALYHVMQQQFPTLTCELTIDFIYRIERDNDTDEEMERVLSHVMLGVGSQTIDIEGWGADDRWLDHIDANMSPWCDNTYNDTEYAVYTDLLQVEKKCEKYGVSLSNMPVALRKIMNFIQRKS